MANDRAPDRTVDVVVIGGGPAGVACAMTLTRLGAEVLLAERSTYDKPRVGETLPPGTRQVVADLALGDVVAGTEPMSSVGVRSIWGSAESHDRSFLFHPYGDGWHVDRRRFDEALAGAAERAGVEIRRGTRLAGCEPEPARTFLITLARDEEISTLRAAFVVDATARASAVARRLGVGRVADDRLVGVFGYYGADPNWSAAGEGSFTLVEAVEDGWWYSAPLPGGGLVVTLMTDADICAAGELNQPARWQALLRGAASTIARTRGRARVGGGLRVVAAGSSHVERAAGPGWIAVGDAAFSRDPLSGDGVPRALQSGLRGAEVIAATVRGDVEVPARYASAVESEYAQYLRRRDEFYGRERRWPNGPFWARRASGSAPTRGQEDPRSASVLTPAG